MAKRAVDDDGQCDNERAFDKTVITLCSGALAYLVYAYPVPFDCHNWAVHVSRLFFALALALVIIGLRLGAKALVRHRQILLNRYEKHDEQSTNGWASTVAVFNWLIVVVMALGVLFFAIYSVMSPYSKQDGGCVCQTKTTKKLTQTNQ